MSLYSLWIFSEIGQRENNECHREVLLVSLRVDASVCMAETAASASDPECTLRLKSGMLGSSRSYCIQISLLNFDFLPSPLRIFLSKWPENTYP